MNIEEQVKKMDGLVSQGAIVDAVKNFFAENATTSDYGNAKTANKAEMVTKMEGFAGAIAQVNGIQHHHTIASDNVTASEFTFDFNMKDGSTIYWHEVIRRVWNQEGQVVQETYFNAE